MLPKTELYLPANWIVSFNNTDDVNIDLEYYILKLKAYEAKVKEKIEVGDFYGFLEHIYHTMNLNSFIVDGFLYDVTFKQIDQSSYLPYVNNIKAKKDDSNILKVIKVAQDIFRSLLILYLSKIPKENTLIFNNHNIHTLNDINILVKDVPENGKSVYHLWDMAIGNNYNFMNSVAPISKFTIPEGDDIVEILTQAKDSIHKNNMIGVDMIDVSSIECAILGIRDILILNRIFKNGKSFTASFYLELSNYIKSTGRFDYRFRVS